MAVRIEINENSIKAKIDNTWQNGLEMLSSQILRDCNMYCKEDAEAVGQGRGYWHPRPVCIRKNTVHKDGVLVAETGLEPATSGL